MTDNNHPITPPPELVQQWAGESLVTQTLCTKAARWGFNQHAALNEAELQKARDEQLDACCDWLDGYSPEGWATEQMRNDCRLKPPSLKEQALEALDEEHADMQVQNYKLIRSVLESLPD